MNLLSATNYFRFKVESVNITNTIRAKMETASVLYGVISQFIEDHKFLTKNAGSGGINTKSLDQRQTLISQIESIKGSLHEGLERLELLYNAVKSIQDEEIRTLDFILGNVKSGRPSGTARAISFPNVNVVNTVRPNSVNSVSTVSTVSTVRNESLRNESLRNESLRNDAVPVQRPRLTFSEGKTVDPAWTLVQRKQKPADVIKTERVPGPRMLQQAPGNYERINITTSITINAIPAKSFADVRCDGSLYYVSSCAHFALMINGLLFHGNIGIIYTDTEDPEKIKDCRFTDGCNRVNSCRYYHDPTIFNDSNDRRNYIASSFIYTSPAAMYKNRSRSRRFGSIENLDTDILGLSDEEKNRTYDQAMHDLLCALVLKSIEPIKNK
jgi:hypothetical protein